MYAVLYFVCTFQFLYAISHAFIILLLSFKIIDWGEENPRIIHEKPMHPKRVTVWCALWSGGVIGPYFFENAAGEAVTVNGVRYREMLSEFFDLNWIILIWMIFGFKRMALHLILLMKQSLYCLPNFLEELLQETVMLIGHQDHVI